MFRTVALLSLLAALSAPLWAQPAPAPIPVPDPAPAAKGHPVVSLEFPGGTLAEFAGALRTAGGAAGVPVNIVGPPEMTQIPVSPVALKAVSIRNALEAVAAVAVGDTKLDVVELTSPGAAPVYAIRVLTIRPPKAVAVRAVRVFSLRALTQTPPANPELSLSAETVLSALETGLGVGVGETATLRYHTDSGLLFVLGSEEQVSVVEQVIGSLTRDLDARRRAAREPPPVTPTPPARPPK